MSNPSHKKFASPAAFIGQEADGLISFGSGQPDLPPPSKIFDDLATKRLFKYGLIQGELELRQMLAADYPKSSADDFVITNGASEALDLTLRAIRQLHGRVKVLVCRPYYYSYPELIRLAGLTPVYTDLIDGHIDLTDFKKKIKDVKAVLINSPSNPTGRVELLDTLREVEAITAKLGVYVLSDEVYKDLIYVRENYLIKGPHVITINSFSKTYSMCGLRVGYLYARDPKILQQVIEIKTHSSMNTNILGQAMAIKAKDVDRRIIDHQTGIWEKRRDFIYNGLTAMGFDLWKPEGAFYVLPKIKHSAQVVSDLFYDHKVIVYDGAWFGAPDRIRLSYALETVKIKAGLERIGEYLKDKQDWLV